MPLLYFRHIFVDLGNLCVNKSKKHILTIQCPGLWMIQVYTQWHLPFAKLSTSWQVPIKSNLNLDLQYNHCDTHPLTQANIFDPLLDYQVNYTFSFIRNYFIRNWASYLPKTKKPFKKLLRLKWKSLIRKLGKKVT